MDTFSVSVSRPRSDSAGTEFVNLDPPLGFSDSCADDEVFSMAKIETERALAGESGALLDLPGVTSHRDFSEVEYERWREGQRLAGKLFSVGQDTLAQKLRDCHNTRTTAICCGCSKRTTFWNRCDIFYCPQCSPRLSKVRLDSLLFYVDKLPSLKHLVLTLRNVDNLTHDYVTAAKKHLARFRRSRIFSGVTAGLWAMEITNKGTGWHLHFHLVISGPWMDVRAISEAWKKANGGSGEVVWIQDASRGGLKKNLPRYVTKYTGKGFRIQEWDAGQLSQFVNAVKGQRMFGVFGGLLGTRGEHREWLKVKRSLRIKCECGCREKVYFSDAELLWRDNFCGWERPKKPRPPSKLLGQFSWRLPIN